MSRGVQDEEFSDSRESISVEQLVSGIEADYRRCYLWTGDIDPGLYAGDCLFTDPTLSFRGLAAFRRNLANLRPFIDTLVTEYRVDLREVTLDSPSQVQARWRMVGQLGGLPWRPLVDLEGTTRFRFDPARGNRIVEYRETWQSPAGEVLLRLLQPGPRDGLPQPADSDT